MKKLSLILALAMLCATAPTAFAENSEYENLILTVKNRVGVPAEYTEFNNLNKYESDGETFYSFMWSSGEHEHSVRVTCTADADVCNYSSYQKSEEYAYLKIDRNEAEKTALEFIEKTNPKLKGKVILDVNAGYSYGGLEFSVTGVFNGIEYYRPIGSVTVTDNKSVSYMNITVPEIEVGEVNHISEDEAYKLYMNNIGVKTEYYTYPDSAKLFESDNSKLISFPVYSNMDFKAIDAITGEVITFGSYATYNTLSAGGGSIAESASDAAYKELTEAERKSITELNNLLTKEEILKIIKERTGVAFIPSSTYLRNSDNNTYYYILSNDAGTFSVNAGNGDIISLHLYFKDTKSDSSVFGNYNLEAAESAKELIELLAPVNGALYETEETTKTKAEFVYKVNDVKLRSPYAYFSKGTDDCYYSFSVTALDRYTDIEYAAPESFITVTEQFSDSSFVKLKYVDTEAGVKAAYLPDDFFINAVTGKNVNSRNEEITDEAYYTYSDLENHWVKTAAERLAYGGIGFSGGVLNPDKNVTTKEASDIFKKIYYSDDITENESALTRFEAAEEIVKRIGLSELSKADIFTQPYSDVTEDYGAVAILKGYGIIAGDTDTFRPDDNITRAEFLQMLYNTLLTQ